MIVLDTNVLSEALKPSPQEPSPVFTTTITQAKILYGIELLPPGKRRARLSAIVKMFADRFQGRILPFDGESARTFAKILWRATLRISSAAVYQSSIRGNERANRAAPINYFYQPH